MTPQQAENFRYNVLDLTKVWPHSEYPLRPVGKIVLDENPQNYFAEIEQAAFSPSHTVPGIEPSADPVLQSRLFSYPDTHRHRLGVNYQQLPVNAPVIPVANFQRDGAATFVSQGARPNYQSTISPLTYRPKPYADKEHRHEIWAGYARAHLYEISERERNLNDVTTHRFSCDFSIPIVVDFEQPRVLYTNVLNDTGRQHLVKNVAAHLGNVKSAEIKARQRKCFSLSHSHFSGRLLTPFVSRRIRRGRPRSLRCHRQGYRRAECRTARCCTRNRSCPL